VSVVVAIVVVHSGGGEWEECISMITFESKAFTSPLGNLNVWQKKKEVKLER
jgi:hypothetical protein